MLELLMKGGPMMVLLLGISIWGAYIVFYMSLFLRKHNLPKGVSIDHIKGALKSGGKAHTYDLFRSDRALLSRVAVDSIKNSHLPHEEIQGILRRLTQFEIAKLDRQLNFLGSIITVAPLLGLMGTVLGLMDIFNVISTGHIGNAELLSQGIAEALITTVTGMAISVPFIFFNQTLSHRLDRFVIRIEQLSGDLIRFCQDNNGIQP